MFIRNAAFHYDPGGLVHVSAVFGLSLCRFTNRVFRRTLVWVFCLQAVGVAFAADRGSAVQLPAILKVLEAAPSVDGRLGPSEYDGGETLALSEDPPGGAVMAGLWEGRLHLLARWVLPAGRKPEEASLVFFPAGLTSGRWVLRVHPGKTPVWDGVQGRPRRILDDNGEAVFRAFPGGMAILELAIPLAALRGKDPGEIPCGLAFRASSGTLPEVPDCFVLIPPARHVSSLQVISETDAAVGSYRTRTGNSNSSRSDWFQNVGVAGHYRLMTNHRISADFSPGFIDLEPDELRITANRRFPLHYRERRSFFGEVLPPLAMPLELLYTRRIENPLADVVYSAHTPRWDGLAFYSVENGVSPSRFGEPGGGSGNATWILGRVGRDLGQGIELAGTLTRRVFPGSSNEVASVDGRIPLGDRGDLRWQGAVSSSSGSSGDLSGAAWGMSVHWQNERVRVQCTQDAYSRDFRSDLGFVERPGSIRTRSDAFVRLSSVWPGEGKLGTALQGGEELVYDFRGRPVDRTESFRGILGVAGGVVVSGGYENLFTRYEEVPFHTSRILLDVVSSETQPIWMEAHLSLGTGVRFDPARPMKGRVDSLEVKGGARPWAGSELRALVLYEQMRPETGGQHLYHVEGYSGIFRQSLFETLNLRFVWNDIISRFSGAIPGEERRTLDLNARLRITSGWAVSMGWKLNRNRSILPVSDRIFCERILYVRLVGDWTHNEPCRCEGLRGNP